MTMLGAIQALNAALALGVEGVSTAQMIGNIMATAQQRGEPITAAQWRPVLDAANAADARLAADIAAKALPGPDAAPA